MDTRVRLAGRTRVSTLRSHMRGATWHFGALGKLGRFASLLTSTAFWMIINSVPLDDDLESCTAGL